MTDNSILSLTVTQLVACRAVNAELIAALNKFLDLNATQGVTAEDWEAATEEAEAALAAAKATS